MTTEPPSLIGDPTADRPRTEIDPPLDPGKLGLKFSLSASGGQVLTMPEGTLETIFGTDEPLQATALMSHCIKVLSPVELGSAGEGGDERHFMLSAVKDMGPRDAVERMLAVQMAATHVAMVRHGQPPRARHPAAPARGARDQLQQARPHLHGPDGGAPQAPDRRAAEGYRGARPRASRRTGHRGRRSPRGEGGRG